MGYTEIGYEDAMVGDDVDAMLGEAYGGNRFAAGMAPQAYRRPMARAGYSPQAMAYAQRQAQSQTLLKEKQWTKSRQYGVGFDSGTTVAAAGAVNLSVQPQVLFRPERLVVSGAIAQSFIITDFKVGKNSQFVASGNLPADAFQPGAFGVRLKCDTAQVSATLTLAVQNLSNSALRFLAALFGEAVE